MNSEVSFSSNWPQSKVLYLLHGFLREAFDMTEIDLCNIYIPVSSALQDLISARGQ